ncbi:MAG: glutamine--fructose-6-phosphate transaminase (isomerizing) [Verrucomicrobia bacterium]|nr:glutamine--fructose-6-phosphate transaminase (isomerizing) [Verrucomicrobiota bacterium]
MCGIIGYVGTRPATPILISGLKRLEYRGYDSAGLALLEPKSISTYRSVGKVAHLVEKVRLNLTPERQNQLTVGIAHTRWATHGAPTEANAHPHYDKSRRICVVHNGIIENYRTIREKLQAKGHKFDSDTDTEALSRLIGECYRGDLRKAVINALRQIEGAYGIAVLCVDEPEKMVVARKGSPLVIGIGEGECLVASDPSALVAHTQRVIYLDDGDVAVITPDLVDIRNLDDEPIERNVSELGLDVGAVEKGGYEHFMLKEIFEQPETVRNALRGRIDLKEGTAILSGMNATPAELAEIARIIAVGCGTSLHAGMVGEFAFEDVAGISTEVQQAAEFRYRNPIVDRNDMVIAISQSGETADTLAAIRKAKEKGTKVFGLVNVVGSAIAREAGRGVFIHAGPEISVASTKAFTGQVAVLLLMALKLGRTRRLSNEDSMKLAQEINRLPELVEFVLKQNDAIAKVAERMAQSDHAFFLGRGPMHPVALEGALKLKEISYVHAEGYHAAEMKHGPIALLTPGVPVVVLANHSPVLDKVWSNAEECKARGARIIAVVTEGEPKTDLADDTIVLPPCSPLVATIPAAVALQLLAYHVARLRGCSIDQPRNLAKSVTVE